jgi:hypothetical protein
MQNPSFDPGLTQKYTGNVRRVINKDGTFNVRRRGATWRDFHPYLHLINLGWIPFFGVLFLGWPTTGWVRATYWAPMHPPKRDDSSTISFSARTP